MGKFIFGLLIGYIFSDWIESRIPELEKAKFEHWSKRLSSSQSSNSLVANEQTSFLTKSQAVSFPW